MARLVFFGNERLATGVSTTAPTLTALIEAGHDVCAVVSNYERGTSRSARELEIEAVAKKHGIPVLLPAKPSEILDELQAYGAEAAVLVAYGRIVPQSVIDVFPKGIINIHPSLLPLHRGPTPIESVILNGETKTGVSIMSLQKEMDAGPVYGQSEVGLTGQETKQELADHLLEIGGKMVVALLPGILDGSVVAKPQDDVAATYDKLIEKTQGVMDWHKPAAQLEREIRAYAIWPKSSTTLAALDVIITDAHVSKDKDGPLAMQTAKDFLVTDKLKPAGKNEMTAADFIRGYGKDLAGL